MCFPTVQRQSERIGDPARKSAFREDLTYDSREGRRAAAVGVDRPARSGGASCHVSSVKAETVGARRWARSNLAHAFADFAAAEKRRASERASQLQQQLLGSSGGASWCPWAMHRKKSGSPEHWPGVVGFSVWELRQPSPSLALRKLPALAGCRKQLTYSCSCSRARIGGCMPPQNPPNPGVWARASKWWKSCILWILMEYCWSYKTNAKDEASSTHPCEAESRVGEETSTIYIPICVCCGKVPDYIYLI